MKRLGAHARRRLNWELSFKRCPFCRNKFLSWASRSGDVVCGVCGRHYEPDKVLTS